MSWSPPVPIDPIFSVEAMSCTSSSFCVAAGPALSGPTPVVKKAFRPWIRFVVPWAHSAFRRGSFVRAEYSCQENPAGAGIKSCRGTVRSGFPIDTRWPGRHTFVIWSRDWAGQTSTVILHYRVTAGPWPASTAVPDSATVDEKSALDIPVLANDSDPNGYRLKVASIDTTGTRASVSINRDGTIHYDPAGRFDFLQEGQTATDMFTYTATDGDGASRPATVTVTITGVNDAPLLSNMETAALPYAAGTTTVPVTSSLTVSDDDDANLTGATVRIASGFVPAEDSLSFRDQNGITGSYDASTGVLALTGSASTGEYQAALRSVGYRDGNPDTSDTEARTITFQVNDRQSALSDLASRTVQVSRAPAVDPLDDSATTNTNSPVNIPVLANDLDPDRDTVTSEGGQDVLPYAIPRSNAVPGNPLLTLHINSGGALQALVCDGSSASSTLTAADQQLVNFQLNGCPSTQINPGGDTCPTIQLAPPSCLYEFNMVDEANGYDAGEVPRFDSGLLRGDPLLRCTSPNPVPANNYPQYLANGTLATGDPRLITIFIVPDSSFSTTSHLIPIAGYADFYVTSWDHDPCANKLAGTAGNGVDAPSPGPGSISGYVVGVNRSLKVASLDATGTKGSASINADGTVHYDPNGQFADLGPGQTTTDTFAYTVTDGDGASQPATVTVTITGS